MNEKPNLLLAGSAILYFLVSIAMQFGPEELLRAAGAVPTALDTGLVQVLGAALFGFALLNWFQRFTHIGGIYGRPLVVANFAHAAVAALSLGHFALRGGLPMPAMAALAVYSVLAIAFGAKFFGGSPT